MKKIIIKGAFSDCIESIEHHNETKTPAHMRTTTIEADNDTPKEEMAKLFTECLWFDIQGYYDGMENDCSTSIEFTVKRPQADIDKWHEERKEHLQYSINRLKKWCDNKEADKEQIITYLNHKKLEWIIEAMGF